MADFGCVSGTYLSEDVGWVAVEASCLASRCLTQHATHCQITVRTAKGGQPLTLIFENERMAVLGRGVPIQVAGRKVVRINMLFNS